MKTGSPPHSSTRSKARAIRLTGVALLIGIVLILISPAASASASPAHQGGSTLTASDSTSTINGNGSITGTCSQGSESSDNNLLALNRWGDATTALHTHLQDLLTFSWSDGLSLNDPIAHITNGMLDGILLNGGNWGWQVAEGISVQAEQFCILYSVGGAVDGSAYQLGEALFNPQGTGATVAVIVLVIGIVTVLYRAFKGAESPAKYIFKAGMVLGLTTAMLIGAHNTTQPVAGGPTTFGFMSPGWFAATTDRTVTTLEQLPSFASATVGGPMSGESTADAAALNMTPVNTKGTPGTCATMLDNMHNAYASAVSNNQASATAGILSNMWEESGLLLWTRAQFGSKGGAPYGDKVACMVLDAMAGQAPYGDATSTANLSGLSALKSNFNPIILAVAAGKINIAQYLAITGGTGGGAFQIFSDLDPSDSKILNGLEISGVGYAACNYSGGSWHVDPNWKDGILRGGAGGITDSSCNDFYTNPGSENGPGQPMDVSADTPPNEGNGIESDFIGSWHGATNNGATLMGCISYLVSSLLIMLVFGGMAVGVIIAKTIACVSVIFIFFVLLLELLPSASDSSRLARFFKFFGSMSLASYAMGFMLSVVSVVSGFLVSASTSMTDPGSVASMMWLGFSPIAACMLIHLVFKHMLNLPSPLKPSSAMAYAGMASGMGAAAAGGIDGMTSRLKNRGTGMLRRGGRKAGRGALGSLGLGAAGGVAGGLAARAGTRGRGTSAMDKALDRREQEINPKSSFSGQSEDQAREEQAARQAWEGSEAGAAGRKQARRDALKQRGRDAIDSFRRNPFKSTGRVVLGAAAVGVGGLPVAGLVGANILRKKIQNRSDPADRRDRRKDQQRRVWEQSAAAAAVRREQQAENERRRAETEAAAIARVVDEMNRREQ